MAGHEVRFFSHCDFETLVRSQGLPFYPVSGKPAMFFGGPAGTALRDRLRSDPTEYCRLFDSYLSPFMEQMLDECLLACEHADAILSWPWMRVAPTVAQKIGIPAIIVSAVPNLYLPTRTFANPFNGDFKIGLSEEQNLLSWRTARTAFGAGQETLVKFRRKTGMRIVDLDEEYDYFQNLPHLFGFSPHILPRPGDWPDNVQVTGDWHLEPSRSFTPADRLLRFLEEGDAPVVIGFSSSVGASPRRLTSLTIEAVRRSGKRAIFVSGFGALQSADLPANILKVDTVPYGWLLPRVAAIVHHAGAGSTADGLRAGKPSLGIPFGWDQPLWAQRLYDLGVGPKPIPASTLSAEQLADGIVKLIDDVDLRDRAARLGTLIRAEDGVGRALGIVDELLQQREPMPVAVPVIP